MCLCCYVLALSHAASVPSVSEQGWLNCLSCTLQPWLSEQGWLNCVSCTLQPWLSSTGTTDSSRDVCCAQHMHRDTYNHSQSYPIMLHHNSSDPGPQSGLTNASLWRNTATLVTVIVSEQARLTCPTMNETSVQQCHSVAHPQQAAC